MNEKQLSHLARLSVPNTLKESTLIHANNRDDPFWRSPSGLNGKRMKERETQQFGNYWTSKSIQNCNNAIEVQVKQGEMLR